VRKLGALAMLAASSAAAQCVMCGRTAQAQNLARASVLNQAIVLLLIPPVVILAGFLLLAWRRRES